MLERTEFIPANTAGSRKDTAVLLVGTATEYGLDQHSILAAQGGFWITAELADLAFEDQPESEGEPEVSGNPEPAYDPDDHTVAKVKEHVEANPDEAAAILAAETEGQNRTTLVEWLTEFTKTSGDRAAKTEPTEE
jgi:hypothetical protein